MGNTKIEWADKTWSPIKARVKLKAYEIAMRRGWKDLAEIVKDMVGRVGPHCEMCSAGCNFCYSLMNNKRRLTYNGTGLPFDRRSRDLVDIFIDEKTLSQPLGWQKGHRIFVENQSDLFGEWIPPEMLARVFNVMAQCEWHTFQVLTKRAEGMYRIMNGPKSHELWSPKFWHRETRPHIWIGVSVEDQLRAERLYWLAKSGATVTFCSYEPAITAVNFTDIVMTDSLQNYRFNALTGELRCEDLSHVVERLKPLSWLIIGGESGRDARPFDLAWARGAIGQARANSTTVFMKQVGRLPVDTDYLSGVSAPEDRRSLRAAKALKMDPAGFNLVPLLHPKGGNIAEWEESLRIREFPRPA